MAKPTTSKKATKKATPANKVSTVEAKLVPTVTPPPEAPTVHADSTPEVVQATPPTTTADGKPTTVTLEYQQDAAGKRYVSKTDPDSAYHLRNRSTTLKPCHVVRAYCAANPTLERKAVIAACIAMGVDKNTAATQYSLWRAKNPLPQVQIAQEVPAGGEEGEVVFQEGDDE